MACIYGSYWQRYMYQYMYMHTIKALSVEVRYFLSGTSITVQTHRIQKCYYHHTGFYSARSQRLS